MNLNTDVVAAQNCKKAHTKKKKKRLSLAEYAVDNRKPFLPGSKHEEKQGREFQSLKQMAQC